MTDVRLHDGTLISTEDGKRTVNTEINNVFAEDALRKHKPSDDFELGTRRFLDDLPMPYLHSRPVAIVAAYTMYGLNAGDIARILRVDTADVIAIRDSSDYGAFMDGILQNVREHDANKVRKKLNKAATKAAKKIVTLSDSNDEQVALKASQDILNRTGHSAKDVIEHRHTHEGGITFRYIDDTKETKTIDVEVNNG